MTLPKLEGLIDVTTAWTCDVSESTGGGRATVTVAPAGTYYWNSHTSTTSSLCSTIGAALTANATLAGTYTAGIADDADTDTGALTISCAGKTYGITWSAGSPAPATATGLATDATLAASHTGTSQAQYLWLAGCGRAPGLLAPDGDEGAPEEDFSQTVSPSGRVFSLRMGSGRYVDYLGFGHVKGSRAWKTYESTANESLQRFWEDVIREGHQFRYHKDRSADATYVTWVAEAGGRFECNPLVPEWWGASALFAWGSRVRKYVAT